MAENGLTIAWLHSTINPASAGSEPSYMGRAAMQPADLRLRMAEHVLDFTYSLLGRCISHGMDTGGKDGV